MVKYFIILSACLSITLPIMSQRQSREQYVEKYKNWAIKEMKRSGVPASITLSQGILESDCGNSMLAVDANNHFGIKCHNGWIGDSVHKDDDKSDECFRKYDSAYESFVDHSDFLTTKGRYSFLFQLDRTDYKSWAKGLSKAGYATDPNYPKRLIDIIEALGLTIYDSDSYTAQSLVIDLDDYVDKNEKESKPSTPRKKNVFTINPFHIHEIEYNNGVQYVELVDGDSFDAIALEFRMSTSELLLINDLDSNADIDNMQYVYVRKKRNRAHPDCKIHVVAEGEKLWDIAHQYGVKIKKLRKFNHLSGSEEPLVGDELYLRTVKK